MLIQNTDMIRAVNERRIIEKYNQTGPYYNVDITENDPVNNKDSEESENGSEPTEGEELQPTPSVDATAEPKPAETPEITEEPTAQPTAAPSTEPSAEPTQIPVQTPQPTLVPTPTAGETPASAAPLEFTQTDTNISEAEQSEYADPEIVDERTVIYTSKEDQNLKKMVMGVIRNYKTADGFAPIDTQLNPAVNLLSEDSTGYFVQNGTNVVRSYYPADSKTGIVLEKDEVRVTVIPQLKQIGEPTAEGAQLIYPMENQINLRYTVMPAWVEEELVLYEKPESNIFTSQIIVENGTVMQGDEHGLVVVDQNEQLSMLIRAPKAKDAAGSDAEITVVLEDGLVHYSVDESWLMSEERVYPIVMDPNYFGYAHNGTDVSVSQSRPTKTLGNPNMEADNWVLKNYDDAFLFVGNHPRYSHSFSFYKINNDRMNEVLKGKYIKKATLNIIQGKTKPGTENKLLACSIPGTYDISKATYLNMPSNFECFTGDWTWEGCWMHSLDITPYVKDVAENNKPNNGVLLTLEDPESSYLEMYASEYYYITGTGENTPYVEAEYYDSPDVTMTDVNQFTWNVRPFVKYDFKEGLAYLVAVGFDGAAPYHAQTTVTIKDGETVKFTETMEAIDNFYCYPDYPEIEKAQSYNETKVSNYQTGKFFDSFEPGKLYTVQFQSVKGTAKSAVKETYFRTYEVKGFDLVSSIASFYGISKETLMADNNLQDELITQGNILFIREPQKNKDVDYVEEDLSTDQKKQVDAALRGRDLQCEFGFEPINLNTGNFILESQDFAMNVLEDNFTFSRAYNSSAAQVYSIFGMGWAFSGFSRIASDDAGATVILEDGTKYYFARQNDGTYINTLTAVYQLRWDTDHFILSNQDSTWIYDSSGLLSRTVDKQGRSTTYTYNQGLPNTITLKDGKTMTFHYNGDHLVDQIQLGENDHVSYTYDDNLNLVTFTDQTGAVIRYAYDEAHNMISWTNQNEALVVTNTYDDQHRVTKQVDGQGNVMTLEYLEGRTKTTDAKGNVEVTWFDANGQTTKVEYADSRQVLKTFVKGLLTEETLENGIHWAYTYDERGNQLTATRSDGFKETRTYDASNNLLTLSNTAGQSEAWTYDASNNKTSYTDALGHTTTYAYNDQQQLISETDPLNHTVSYQYNDQGRVSKVTYPDGTFSTFTYNDAGYLLTTTDQDNRTTTHVLNARNEIVQIINPDGGTQSMTYDAAGNKLTESDFNGNVTSYEYDLYGNVVKMTDPLGNVTAYTYDKNQNLIKTTYPDGAVTSRTVDSRGRTLSETINGLTTTYTYNQFGVATETNAHNQTKTLTYDTLGNVIKTQDFDGLETQSTYDALGRVLTTTDKAGNVTAYTYDAKGQRISVETARQTTVYAYDALGHEIKQTLTSGDTIRVTEKNYDAMGNLTSIKDPLGHTTSYAYDKGLKTKMTDALGQETLYAYDAMERVISETSADQKVRTWTYDHQGNILTATDTNGHTTTFVYNGNHQVIEQKDALNNRTTTTTDSRGRTTLITTPLGNKTGFQYDIHGRLTQKTRNGKVIESYVYDQYGNLTSQTILGLTTTFAYDAYDQLVKTTEPTGLVTENILDNLHRLTQVKVNGEIQKTYTYDVYDQVISETDAYGSTTTYIINSLGQITKKTDHGVTTQYTYDASGNVTVQTDSLQNTKAYAYDALNRVITETINGSKLTYAYDLRGNLTQLTDRNGNTTTSVYDGENNLLSVTVNGHTTASVYNAVNQKTVEKVDNQTIHQWAYDADGRLIKETDGLGGITQTVYNPAGLISKTVDPMGYATEYTYDDHDNLTITKDAKGNTLQRQYNALNQCVKETSKIGGVTAYEYDVFGNVKKTTYPDGGIETVVYNAKNQKISETKTNGAVLKYSYNAYNQLLKTWQNDVLIEENVYDSIGNKIETYDALRHKTSWQYDKSGRVILRKNALNQTQTYTYDAEDRMLTQTDEAGITTSYIYDAAQNVLVEKVNNAKTTTRTYNAFNQVLSETDPTGNTTLYEYDLNQQRIKTIDALNHTTTTEYNASGYETATVDANGKRYEKVYDEVYNLIQEKDPLNHLVTYTYDAAGNMTSVQDARGFKLNYTLNKMGKVIRRYYDQVEVLYVYNTAGELIKATDEDKKSEEYTYDLNGNLTTLKQKDGTLITYTYDANQNLLSKPDATFTYDALDRVASMTDDHGSTQYTYDAAGNTIKVVRDNQTIQYQYDAYGNRTKITYPDNTSITYQYDLSGRMTKTVNASHYSNYEYDALGRLIKESMCNNVVITKSYDNNGNLLTQLTKLGSRTLSSYTYVYNAVNSVSKQTEVLNGITTVKDYSYNENDELIKTVKTQGSTTTTTQTVITLTGNKTEVTEGQVTYRATYDDFNRIKTYYDGTSHFTYSYDQRGNRIREGRDDNAVREYTYNDLNQLIRVKDFDGTVTTYAYDGAGNRIQQTADRTNMVYTSSPAAITDSIDTLIQQLKETSSEATETHQTEISAVTRAATGNTTTITYLNDELAENPVVLVKTQDNAKTKYWYGNERLCTNDDFYLYDGQGSVTILLSGSNQVLSTYSYSDYGRRDKKYNPFVSSSDEYGYRSEAHNSDETQYLRARYYDTVTELFISADGYRGDWQDPLSQNRYNYGRNNPNKYFDPTGKWSVWGAIKGAVNSAAKAVNKVVQTVKNAFTPPKKSPQPKNSYTPPKKSTPTQNVTNPTGARTAPPIYSKYDKAIQYTAPSNNNNNYNNNGSSNGGSGGGSGSKSSGKNTTAQSQAEAQKAAELFRQRIEEQHGTLMKSVQKAKAGLAEKEQEKRKVEAIMASIQEPRFNLEFLNKMGSLYNRVSGWCKERGKEIKEVGDNFKKGAKELGDQLNEALLGGLQHVSDTIGSVSEAISKLTWKDVGKATVTTIAAGLTFAAIFVPGGGVVGAVINGFAAGGAAGAAGSLASSTFEIVDAVQANSEDELLKKYNAKDWAELAHNYLEQAGNSMVHGSIAGGVAAGTQAYIDSKLHPEGSVVQSGNETIDEVKPYANSRPSYRKGVVDEVWENAKGPDGLVRDPNTGEVINWTPGDSRNGVWDMGHVPGQKYSVMHDAYMKGIISKQEFLDWYNDPSNYRPELPSNNRSHMYE
ncbi:GH-E family nuclease [Holdemania massiliensis]|nr:GH-E family nuclease [Holdemania massiliensis]